MNENEVLMFSDPENKPDETKIFSIIGGKKVLWQDLMNYIKVSYPEASGEWNYYKDGKQWLLKTVLRKTTIFWCVILDDTFRITFYFGDKAEPLILASSIPDEIKEQYINGKRYGKIRAISLKIKNNSDIEVVKTIIPVKVRMK